MQRRFKVPWSNNLSVADLGGAWGDRPMSTTKEIVFSQWKGLKISLYYFWVAIKHILWSESLHLHYLAPYKKNPRSTAVTYKQLFLKISISIGPDWPMGF